MRTRLVLLAISLTLAASAADRRTSFNSGWRFLKGDVVGAERVAFEDSGWRKLNLPHDWAIEGPFDKKHNSNTGGLPIDGTGWYRKHFVVPASSDLLYSLEIDGAMSNSTVYLNGTRVGGRPYGYASFAVDLRPQKGDNVIAVRVSPEPDSSRWYPGAGLYRNVWLVATNRIRVDHWGTFVKTPEVTDAMATVVLIAQVFGGGGADVVTEIQDASGRTVANASAVTSPSATDSVPQMVALTLKVRNPMRWDIEHPYLYKAITTVRQDSKALDRYETPFGIRTIEFDREKGFLLNGRSVKLKGVCNHHDLGALGAAVNTRAIERQIEILKAMGMNAIRTSHNPPAPELLDACDRLGVLVMDEGFDMWRIPKVKNGAAKFFDEWGERDFRDMIRRDRNHPSIIMWSIGNEVPEQGRADGWEIAKRLTGYAHEEDPPRPTTSGFNEWTGAIKNGLADQVDLPGFNYKPMYYDQIRREHPKWIIYGSETASCVSSRGVYHLPLEAYDKHPSTQVTSYDVVAPPWAYCPDVEFEAQERNPGLLGEFVWTGFDYLGEPTPYGGKDDWARSSYFGIVDLAGFPKDRYYLYQSVWTAKPVLHLLPHWNWAGREGQSIPVMAYTNAQEVELFLNGKSLGRKKLGTDRVVIPVNPYVSDSKRFTTRYRLQWDVPYAPGNLRAVGYREGKQVAVDEVKTAGVPARLKLSPDRVTLHADGSDLAFITVRVEDKNGNLCPGAANLITFRVTGEGGREAVDNGDATSLEPFQADQRKAFSGLALLIVRPSDGRGKIEVSAESPGLTPAHATLAAIK